LSFTKAAANEIKHRLPNKDSNVAASTIHSLAFNLLGLHKTEVVTRDKLRQFGELVGIPITGVVDMAGDEERIIEEGDEALGIMNRARASNMSYDKAYERSERPLSAAMFSFMCKAYDKWKISNGLIDFADMLTAYITSAIPVSYDILIIDEAQDMSVAQWEVVDCLSKYVKRIYIAGDDDQALFSFIGAQPRGMLKFSERYCANRNELTQSYRIPASVHSVAMRIRSEICEKDSITYAPRQYVGIVRYFGDVDDLSFDTTDSLILYRTHSLRRGIEKSLIENSVPYKVLSGSPAPWDGRFGYAVKALRDVISGKEPTLKQKRVLDKFCTTRTITHTTKWQNSLDIPSNILNYMAETEGQKQHVRLSTIHGAKGMEADRVVLLTSMTERVLENFEKDPDSEHRVYYVGVTRARETLDIVDGVNAYSI